ncbi:transcriptional regulator [Dyadobacter bucti]|uniref:transcriptional regulator n=1 Tax=Dyadobacter bucti TaxID=2572203 RepID=UPI001E3F2CB6|nr:transcriptional regulator [Dyadobacter bucti]
MANKQSVIVSAIGVIPNRSHSSRSVFDNYKNQLEVVYSYLSEHIATATMISIATGIPQKNICRYKRKLEKAGLVYQAELGICEVTGYSAWYLCAISNHED